MAPGALNSKLKPISPTVTQKSCLNRYPCLSKATWLTTCSPSLTYLISVRRLILERAEGNPFYLEEIIRSLIDQGIILYEGEGRRATSDITNIIIPDTLQGVLLARIDQLQEDVRRTLQVASVIGRSFLYRLLEAVAEAETKLDSHLAQLQRVDLVREKTHKPELEYIFKHSLTQEAAYNSLLLERRQKFHLIVAEALENLFSDRKDEYSGMLAHHYERAGLPEQAALYYLRAAEVARQVYANEEVIALLKRGLALVENGILKSGGDEHSCVVVTRLWEELGDVLELRAQHEEALHAYQSAQAIVSPGERLWKARLYRKAGVPLREQRLYAQALKVCNQAEVTLGEPQDRTDIDWWREWVEVQVDRIWAHYWLAQWPEMEALVNKVQPLVQEIGGSAIRSRYLMASLMPHLRKERYAVSDEMLAISRVSLSCNPGMGRHEGQSRMPV